MSVRRLGGVQVVVAEGTVDLPTVRPPAEAVAAALTQRPARLVIDLTEVGFLAAAGLRVQLYAQHDAGDGTQLRVVAISSHNAAAMLVCAVAWLRVKRHVLLAFVVAGTTTMAAPAYVAAAIAAAIVVTLVAFDDRDRAHRGDRYPAGDD